VAIHKSATSSTGPRKTRRTFCLACSATACLKRNDHDYRPATRMNVGPSARIPVTSDHPAFQCYLKPGPRRRRPAPRRRIYSPWSRRFEASACVFYKSNSRTMVISRAPERPFRARARSTTCPPVAKARNILFCKQCRRVELLRAPCSPKVRCAATAFAHNHPIARAHQPPPPRPLQLLIKNHKYGTICR
jgi:hypothetical protein